MIKQRPFSATAIERFPVMKRFVLGFLVMTFFGITAPARASLSGLGANKSQPPVNLVSSKIKVTIGAQWIDVEEEAELQIVQPTGSAVYQLSGQITLPPSALVTGALFWRGDTVLRGKLHLRVDAVSSYNQIVNDTSSFSSDPLLIEKVSNDDYKLRAYPFVPNGVRRIRIRYLVPVTSRSGDVPVLPVFSQVTGSKPSNWTLQTRGKASGLKLSIDGMVKALASPAIQTMAFPKSGTATIVWGANASVGVERAVFDQIASGPWAGDYVLYTGKIPDSLARKVEIKSETVILWRWIHPETFVVASGTDTLLTDDGNLAVTQAQGIGQVADWIAGEGNKVALVTDLDMDEASVVHAMGDSGSTAFGDLKTWINGVDPANVRWRVGGIAPNAGLELERNRARFASDLSLVGNLFSKDPGVVKHLLVVTVGPNPSGGDNLQNAVDSGLPADVSVASTRFDGQASIWNARDSVYIHPGYAFAIWPGVNLPSLEKARPGARIVWVNGVRVPRSRNMVSATISIAKASDTIAVYPTISKGSDGNWLASLNVHDAGLGKTLKWKVFDEQGAPLVSWETSPAWTNLVDDSIVPRLWSVAPLRTSLLPGFSSSSTLGDVFGYVDPKFAMLALRADSLSHAQSSVLVDSGVPFLTSAEIFGSAKYKEPSEPVTGLRHKLVSKAHLAVTTNGNNLVRIDFSGEKPVSLEILDVQGRVLVRWSGMDLAGMSSVEWAPRDRSALQRGLILVRMVTVAGVKSQPFALPM